MLMTSLRKFASDIAASPWKLLTRLAQSSKVRSKVTPASSVIGSYFVLPGIWCGPLASPPSYHGVTSVVRLSALHLFSAATAWPSTTTLKRNPRYGSKRVLLTVNLAIRPLSLRRLAGRQPGLLADLGDDELGRLQGREAHQHVDHPGVDVRLCGGLRVALDEEALRRRGALERALPEQVHHERAHVAPDLRPQRLVVRLEHGELDAV